MIDLRPVVHILGWISGLIGAMLFLPAMADAMADNPDWRPFAESGAFSLVLGLSLSIATMRTKPLSLDLRQAFLVTVLGWIVVAVLGAIPMMGIGIGFVDALFEAMSGITTTGSTVIVGLDSLPPGLLLWRAILQWIGGIGIIAIAILILPLLRVGGMQMFKIESSDVSLEKVSTAVKTIVWLAVIYAALTSACGALYFIFGMSGFDAVTHAMTTLSTGGYSTHDDSFGHFPQASLHWIAVIFMVLGGLPFGLYIKELQGKGLSLLSDQQVRGFLIFLFCAGMGLAIWLVDNLGVGFGEALTISFFNVVSIVTTTGFASEDYGQWGHGPAGFFLVLMFVGGCSGSTSGAIKIYRFQVLFLFVNAHLKRLFSPNRVIPLRYNGRSLSEDVAMSVLAFLAVFVATIAVVTVILAALGLDLVTAYSASVTAITNVGPGLGPVVGPAGNFAGLPDAAKLVLTGAMLAGRLEVLALLVVLSPDFWHYG